MGVIGTTPAAPIPTDRRLFVGGHRHLAALAPPGVPTLPIGGDLDAVLDGIEAYPGPVCVLASGDPGFFGVVRALSQRFGPRALDVRPAPSSVSLAFARLGLAWDDAVVVSAHGRPLADAALLAAAAPKAAVLVSPESPPEALGTQLLAIGARHQQVAVCSRLGDDDERVEVVDLETLSARTWDPLSVVLLLAESAAPASREASPRSLAWGRPEGAFSHRAGMVTKAEVRAVVLSKLELAATGVLWDVGAGSGSVAIECALVAPELRVIALERDPAATAHLRANVAAHEAVVEVIEGEAPGAFDLLPDPDRAFVGGGGLAALDGVLARLRPGGRVVATFAALDRAVAAADRLGALVQLGLARGRRLPDGGLRLAAENPVFVAWGPEPQGEGDARR